MQATGVTPMPTAKPAKEKHSPQRRYMEVNRFSVSLKDIILLVTIAMSYAVMQYKINDLQARYEREVVPRAEHLQMNAVLDQQLQSIMDIQKQTQRQLDKLQLDMDRLRESSLTSNSFKH